MNIQELSNKWLLIPSTNGGEIMSLRIDGESIPDLFIGINPMLNRCLIIKLPSTYIPDFQSSIKQNLSLELFSNTKFLVLTLLDRQYQDLFDDLVISIYNKIHLMTDVISYTSEFIKTYYKWSEFFHDNRTKQLSDEAIRGLFGELIFLNETLKLSGAAIVNDTLNSWKGPYDSGHDFIGENKNTEVKTRLSSSNYIKISSEFQLQPEVDKTLDLAVVTINPDPFTGITLKDIALATKDLVMAKLGDYSIFLDALSQKGLTSVNIGNYDHLKFIALDITTYSCMHDNFPRLIRSTLPDAVTSVSYKLNLFALTDYLTTSKPL